MRVFEDETQREKKKQSMEPVKAWDSTAENVDFEEH